MPDKSMRELVNGRAVRCSDVAVVARPGPGAHVCLRLRSPGVGGYTGLAYDCVTASRRAPAAWLARDGAACEAAEGLAPRVHAVDIASGCILHALAAVDARC